MRLTRILAVAGGSGQHLLTVLSSYSDPVHRSHLQKRQWHRGLSSGRQQWPASLEVNSSYSDLVHRSHLQKRQWHRGLSSSRRQGQHLLTVLSPHILIWCIVHICRSDSGTGVLAAAGDSGQHLLTVLSYSDPVHRSHQQKMTVALTTSFL